MEEILYMPEMVKGGYNGTDKKGIIWRIMINLKDGRTLWFEVDLN